MTIIGKDFVMGVGFYKTAENFLKNWIAKVASEYVVVTWGMEGSYGFDNTTGSEAKDIIHVPANITPESDVAVDSLGAGDTYNAALCYKMLNGSPLEDSMKFAALVASIKCKQVGLANLKLPGV